MWKPGSGRQPADGRNKYQWIDPTGAGTAFAWLRGIRGYVGLKSSNELSCEAKLAAGDANALITHPRLVLQPSEITLPYNALCFNLRNADFSAKCIALHCNVKAD